jgi:DNA-binding response OmpR family regulator
MRAQPLIVVADDDRDTRELYRACFDLSGFRTAEAATGSDAIALTRRILPDVLLTDLVLPDLDGCAVATSLRDDARTANVCVFLVTGHPSPDLWSRATMAGIARLFTKPCPPRVLLREVQRALARRNGGIPRNES